MEEKQKTYISSSKMWQWSYELGRRILASGWKPDLVVGLYRGGVFPAIVIEDYLRSNGIRAMHFPLHCQSYDADAAESTSSEVKVVDLPEYVLQSISECKNVLIVDDICDTGKTLEAVKNKIKEAGKAQVCFKFRTACLLWKPDVCDAPPTWWIKEAAEDEWIVFPHEFVGVNLKEKLVSEKKEP